MPLSAGPFRARAGRPVWNSIGRAQTGPWPGSTQAARERGGALDYSSTKARSQAWNPREQRRERKGGDDAHGGAMV
jgi:hypothetical protein